MGFGGGNMEVEGSFQIVCGSSKMHEWIEWARRKLMYSSRKEKTCEHGDVQLSYRWGLSATAWLTGKPNFMISLIRMST